MYHSFEYFQKPTVISKKYLNYFLVCTHTNESPCIDQNVLKKQYQTHQDKKAKTSNDIDFNLIHEYTNCDLDLNNNNHCSSIYDSSLLDEKTEFNNRIKITIQMKHNLTRLICLRIYMI